VEHDAGPRKSSSATPSSTSNTELVAEQNEVFDGDGDGDPASRSASAVNLRYNFFHLGSFVIEHPYQDLPIVGTTGV
jgi:hypothetical protein